VHFDQLDAEAQDIVLSDVEGLETRRVVKIDHPGLALFPG
jgi:hypothetical protein